MRSNMLSLSFLVTLSLISSFSATANSVDSVNIKNKDGSPLPTIMAIINSPAAEKVNSSYVYTDTQSVDYNKEEDYLKEKRLQRISRSVHLLLSESDFSYTGDLISSISDNKIALNFLSVLDEERSVFNQNDIDMLVSENNQDDIHASIVGQGTHWIEKVAELYKIRQGERLDFFESIDVETYNEKDVLSYKRVKDKEFKWLPSDSLNEIIKMEFYVGVFFYLEKQKNEQKSLHLAKEQYLKDYTIIIDQDKRRAKQYFVEMFLNSYANLVDPHSAYLGPMNKNAFEAKVFNTFSGIGILFEKSIDDKVVVKKIYPDSPASKIKEINVGSYLLRVQDSKGNFIKTDDVSFNEIMQLVSLSSSNMVFGIKDKNGAIKEIVVSIDKERVVIDADDNMVSSKVIEKVIDGESFKTLVVSIPSFYMDVTDTTRVGGSSSFDLKRIIKKETKDNYISLVVLDLRNNGGGVLTEAIEMLSMFIQSGPAVQLKTSLGEHSVINIKNPDIVWTGPLSVIINQNSASASEIVAAALQDHGRALILGQRSYGKGSAQTLLDLDSWAGVSSVYGQLNLTTMMFFRPLGPSTQLIGVVPDIYIGDKDDTSHGERKFDNAIPPQDAGSNGFSYPSVKSYNKQPWQSRRVEISLSSNARWREKSWYSSWFEIQKSSQDDMSVAQIIDFREKYKELREQLNQDGKVINDNVGSDAILRESIIVSSDAFL